MTDVIDLLAAEEGFRARPYVCSEGYPTVGFGFKLGPKIVRGTCKLGENIGEACKRLYDFTLPRVVGELWLAVLIADLVDELATHPRIGPALRACREADGYDHQAPSVGPREAILVSMAFQMGVDGLAAFRQTLLCMQSKDWRQAETQMLKSRWAGQTPKRASRHAAQIRTGKWDAYYDQVAEIRKET